MITLQEFGIIFNDRHDFEYDDMKYLPSKYPHVTFKSIPEAWVVLVETFLLELEEPLKISSVSQEIGHLLVQTNESLNDHDCDVLIEFEKHTISLDMDIHRELKEGIILN